MLWFNTDKFNWISYWIPWSSWFVCFWKGAVHMVRWLGLWLDSLLVTIKLFLQHASKRNLPDEFTSPFANLTIFSGDLVLFNPIFALKFPAIVRESRSGWLDCCFNFLIEFIACIGLSTSSPQKHHPQWTPLIFYFFILNPIPSF